MGERYTNAKYNVVSVKNDIGDIGYKSASDGKMGFPSLFISGE